MKLARQDSARTFEVGVKKDRVVNLTVSTRGKVNIVRYFSQEEMNVKYERAREEGRASSYVAPYISQTIPREAGEILQERRDDIVESIIKVKNGEDLESDEDMIKLGRSDDCRLFLKIDSDTSTCHIRKYWVDNQGELKPTQRGVCVSCDELINILMAYDEAFDFIDEMQRCSSEKKAKNDDLSRPRPGGGAGAAAAVH